MKQVLQIVYSLHSYSSVYIRKAHDEELPALASRGQCMHESEPLPCEASLASVLEFLDGVCVQLAILIG